MLILTEFFKELENIQYFNQSPTRNYLDFVIINENYVNYLESRIDFQYKYRRILRGISLLTDHQFKLLFEYFTGILKPTEQEYRIIDQLIHDIESAI